MPERRASTAAANSDSARAMPLCLPASTRASAYFAALAQIGPEIRDAVDIAPFAHQAPAEQLTQQPVRRRRDIAVFVGLRFGRRLGHFRVDGRLQFVERRLAARSPT